MQLVIDDIRQEILDDNTRYKCIVSGRRWGKTIFSIIWLLQPEFKANEKRWIVFPTYRQAKMVAWSTLKNFFKHMPVKVNETELSITLDNGSTIELKGADASADKIRGVSLDRVVLDEYAYMKESVWNEVIQPMCVQNKAEALFVGTPNGLQNHFYDMFVKGQSNNDQIKSWQFTTLEGGFIEQEEIDNAKKNLDARTFRQEYEANFESIQNKAIYNFNRDVHVKTMEASTRQFWGVDFGVSSLMTAIKMCQFIDGTIYVMEEIGLQNSNTFELAKLMQTKGPGLPVYPDPAGKARTSNSTKSDHAILRDAGFSFISRKSIPRKKDRLNATNRKFENAEGKHELFINPKCKNLIRDLELTTIDEGRIVKTETLSHFLDGLMYPIEYRFGFKGHGSSIKW